MKARARLVREAGMPVRCIPRQSHRGPPPPRPPFLFHDEDRRASQEALVVKNPPAVQETESRRLNP